MVGLLTCKNEEDPIKNKSARVVTTLYIHFSDAQGQITPELVLGSGGNLHLFNLLWLSLVTCKNEEDPFKNEGARVVITVLPL